MQLLLHSTELDMLPDFVRVKRHTNRNLLRWVRVQIPELTPLIRGIATLKQHEGNFAGQNIELDFVLTREELRRPDMEAIRQKLTDLARQIGQAQEKRLLEVAAEAADSVGNVVHATGEVTPDKILEVLRRVHMDFDPRTLQPTGGHAWVMAPETAAVVVPKLKEWEKVPEFTAEYEQIMSIKREEWNAREADRKLVD